MTTTHRDTEKHDHGPCAHKETITTDAGGDATVYLGPFTGSLNMLFFEIGTLTSGAVDVTVTVEETTEAVWSATNLTASQKARPRVTPVGITNTPLAALTVLEPVFLVNDRLKVVVAQGGNVLAGAITAIIQ